MSRESYNLVIEGEYIAKGRATAELPKITTL